MGQNPAVGGQHAGPPAPGAGQARLDSSSATCTRPRPPRSGATARRSAAASCSTEDIETGGLPAARPRRTARWTAPSRTPSACCSGTTRRRPAGRRPLRLWFTDHLGRRLKELYADCEDDRDWPIQALHLGLRRPRGKRRVAGQGRALGQRRPQGDQRLPPWPRSRAGRSVRRPEGRRLDGLRRLDLQRRLRADQARPRAQPRGHRAGDDWVSPELGLRVAGEPPDPVQPRVGRPRGPSLAQGGAGWRMRLPECGRLRLRDPDGRSGTRRQGVWVGLDVPDFPVAKRPTAARQRRLASTATLRRRRRSS